MTSMNAMMSNKTVPRGLPLAMSRLAIVPMLMAKKRASVLMVMESSDDDDDWMSPPPPWRLGWEVNIANSRGYQMRWFQQWRILSSGKNRSSGCLQHHHVMDWHNHNWQLMAIGQHIRTYLLPTYLQLTT